MGWNLNEFGLNDSTVNKYRQTYVLFEEIRKTNVEQVNVSYTDGQAEADSITEESG